MSVLACYKITPKTVLKIYIQTVFPFILFRDIERETFVTIFALE